MQRRQPPGSRPAPLDGGGAGVSRLGTTATSREEIARLEVGHTEISVALSRTLTAVFLLTISLVPVLQSTIGMASRRSEVRSTHSTDDAEAPRLAAQAPRSRRPPEIGLLSRVLSINRQALRTIESTEDRLEERSLVGAWLRPRVQAFLTGALGAGNEEVYCGRSGWLFFRPAVDHLTKRGFLDRDELERRAASTAEWQEAPEPNPVPTIVEFRDQLAERGVELLVVPVPVKASIHPEMLSPRYDHAIEPVTNPSFPRFIADLDGHGVHFLDPTPLLWRSRSQSGDPQYLQTDTHWTPEAMDLVAGEVADIVRGLLAARADPANQFTDEPVRASRIGDLAEMLELPSAYPAQTVRVARVIAEKGARMLPSGSAEVLLLGDSFANIYAERAMGWGTDGGLAQRLVFHLQRPVDALIRNDDGAFATRLMLSQQLSDGSDRLAGTRIVVWEFTARELSFGDWRSIPFDRPPTSADDFFVPPPGVAVEIEGTIAAVADVPDPRSAPYADYIVGLHLVDLTAETDLNGRQALVFAWAMQERRLTPGADYRVGQRIRLKVRPWADVDRELESVSRGELYQGDLYLQTPCWGEEPTP